MNWHQLKQRFDALKLSERRLIYAASIGLLVWLGFIYFIEPSWQQLLQQKQQQQNMTQQLVQTRSQISALQQELSRDINQQHRDRIAELSEQLQQLQQSLATQSAHFIGAERMLSLLHSILQTQPQVRLMALSSLTPSVIAVDEQQQPLLYEHKIRVVLEGTYQSLADVMNHLEKIPWQLGWSSVHYKVQHYPKADIIIEIITVGDDADFIKL